MRFGWRYSFAVLILIVVGVLTFHDAEARYVWERWRAAPLALALDRSDAPLAMEMGNYYFGAVLIGNAKPHYDPTLAKRAFTEALAIQPGVLWGHYSLARIAFAAGDFQTALTEINAELAANPENLRSLYIRGLIYGYRNGLGDLALAETDFTRFITWSPDEWAGYNDLAWVLIREGKYRDALAALDIAFKKVPQAEENPWLLNDRGLAYLDLGEKAQAATDFAHALTLAEQLTETNWRQAYSGDDPASDSGGLSAFRQGVQANLNKAKGQ